MLTRREAEGDGKKNVKNVFKKKKKKKNRKNVRKSCHSCMCSRAKCLNDKVLYCYRCWCCCCCR